MVRRVAMPTAAIEAGRAIENAIQGYRDVVKAFGMHDEEARMMPLGGLTVTPS